MRSRLAWLLVGAALFGLARAAHSAATIVILNLDGAGTGFNDPTPAAPVGGNTGTTLGQQRLIAFQAAANVWGATLTSPITITIQATFPSSPASCPPGEATNVTFPALFHDFPGAPFAGTNYVPALARKLANSTLGSSAPDFGLRTCLPPSSYYLGLDNNHGAQVDLVSAFLHGMGHGFGFWNHTASLDGAWVDGLPYVWDRFLLDTSTGLSWFEMTQGQRSASARNAGKVVWTGANASYEATGVLATVAIVLEIAGSEAGATSGEHHASTAVWFPSIAFTGKLLPALRAAGGTGGACDVLLPLDALAVQGNVALIERGGCADLVQVKNVQDAGAIAAVLIDLTSAVPPPAPTGSDPTVTIPSAAISLVDGNALRSRLLHRGRRTSGVTASLRRYPDRHIGTDASGRMIMDTPAAWTSSSASHWDARATPNLLMEPALNGDVPHFVVPSYDLTFSLLQDIGW